MNESQEKWKTSFLRKHFIMTMVADYCLISLYSRSRCTNVDSTFGKTNLELSHTEEMDMEMLFMLLLHVYLIGILLKTSQIVFTILMISERKYICISYQWQIYYPSVIWDGKIDIWMFLKHSTVVPYSAVYYTAKLLSKYWQEVPIEHRCWCMMSDEEFLGFKHQGYA